MPDFTSVFTEERDHWRARAETAEAELALRDGYQVRPMTEAESNLMTQVLDLRQERAALQAEVERLRGALDRTEAHVLKLGGAAGPAILAALAVRTDGQ